MTTFYTRRSAIVLGQRCPRKRYWEYLAFPTECECAKHTLKGNLDQVYPPGNADPACSMCHGTGIQSGIMRERLNVPLLVGSAVHAGLAELLNGVHVEQAVGLAVRGYDSELAQCGLALHDNEEAEYVAAEQRALTEALVRLASLQIVPRLLERYDVIWTERDFERELAPGVVLRGKPDALLREKSTGDLFILSWKTKGGTKLDDRALEDAQHDDQGLSESWLVDEWLQQWDDDAHKRPNGPFWPRETSGVIMVWLLKGDRREYPKGSGRYTQSSPLIRGWKKFNDDGQVEYAHSYYWTDPDGASHKLGRGWSKFDAWLEPGGVKGWMVKLQEGAVQPDAGPCLDSQFVMSAPYYRQPDDITDWVQQAAWQENGVASKFDEGDLPSEHRQHRHSCSYPSRCSFYQICWGAPHIRANPLENGFVRRRPILPVENGEGVDSE